MATTNKTAWFIHQKVDVSPSADKKSQGVKKRQEHVEKEGGRQDNEQADGDRVKG